MTFEYSGYFVVGTTRQMGSWSCQRWAVANMTVNTVDGDYLLTAATIAFYQAFIGHINLDGYKT